MNRQVTRQLLCLSLGIIGLISMAFAQTDATASLPDPEYENKFYAVGNDGKLVNLEVEQPRQENNKKNYGIKVKVTSVLAVPNTASTVRLPPTAHFVVKGDTQGMDPATLIKLGQLTIAKNERILPQSSATGSLLGAHGAATDDTLIPVTVKKYGQKSFEIIPSSPIPPGEYALYANGRQYAELDCFGIDVK